MAAKSMLLQSSSSSTKNKLSCCLSSNSQSSLIESKTTNVGFQRRFIGKAAQVKWESFGLNSLRRREPALKKERGAAVTVRCTAEGIERRMPLVGETAVVKIPERFKVVALMACVMCLCNADRVVMSVAVVPLAEKLATLLTPWAANHSTVALLAIRAFFGLAEGVALPSMSTLLSR
ncbi:putative anion transporter 3, chloroplastic-like protein [Corchorus olitorius]|uniref:Anion transporter 3, chloroplastic-like protein n=1 Tax=Corchorus olitorius TaxID=93759 RepID=A0A1R3JRN1_9ROSI|nr:putative anion transporter 3, chloroplastic-like protein [Corchorus olitorius]